MKIQNTVVIDGNIVDKVFQNKDLTIYECKPDIDHMILYFVKNEYVLFKQEIFADCGQNQGFISDVNFKEI